MAMINKPKRRQSVAGASDREMVRRKVYDSVRWRRLRALKLQNNPLCERCEELGAITPAEDIHHKVSFLTGRNWTEIRILAYDFSNLMSLCKKCHQLIHNGA